MKKILAVVIVCILAASMSITAFAGEITGADGSDSKDVKGTYVAGSSSNPVYSVDVTWGNLSFTYTGASEGTWDPDTHSYTGSTEAGWTVDNTDGDKITVTNHSNAAVTVNFAFVKDTTNGANVTGSFKIGTAATTGTSFTLAASQVGNTDATDPSNFARLVIGGEIAASNDKIGVVTVTIG